MPIVQFASRHGAQILNAVNGQPCSVHSSAVVTRSWTRCLRDFQLDPAQQRMPAVLSQPQFNERLDRMSELIACAKPEMSTLYQKLADPDLAVLLTDVDGVIVHMVSAAGFAQDLKSLGLRTGALWSEREAGTNGVGTCLIEAEPVAVRQHEHYFAQYTALASSAAPVFNERGELAAVLDVTSRAPAQQAPQAQQHSLVLVGIFRQMMENRLFDQRQRHAHQAQFHSRPELVHTFDAGKLALDGAGRVLAANRSALLQLDVRAPAALLGRTIDELFQTSLDELLARCAPAAGLQPVPVYERERMSRFFLALRPPWPGAGGGAGDAGAGAARTAHAAHVIPTGQSTPRTAHNKAQAGAPRQPGAAACARLAFGDAQLQAQLQLAQRVIARAIPVLLHGETGSGKEVFANALHHGSPAGAGAFVAVNCASLPENLIESELFGYRAGAFTGAQREGRRGKIVQANGGTLFLDEIGDMPLALQSRLLRVLEDHKVSPLGSEAVIEVDFQLISASHRNLAELVQAGQFRADLFYRLSGMELQLPPLRERSDRLPLIEQMLAQEALPAPPPRLAPEAVQALLRHPWPGNLRQLRHALRIALALCDGGATIGCEHLPQDVVQGAKEATAPCAVQPELAGLSDGEARALAQFNAIQLNERDTLIALLHRHRWNISTVARLLAISRNTLYRKLHRLHIHLEQTGGAGAAVPDAASAPPVPR